jgi:hypothetical protein
MAENRSSTATCGREKQTDEWCKQASAKVLGKASSRREYHLAACSREYVEASVRCRFFGLTCGVTNSMTRELASTVSSSATAALRHIFNNTTRLRAFHLLMHETLIEPAHVPAALQLMRSSSSSKQQQAAAAASSSSKQQQAAAARMQMMRTTNDDEQHRLTTSHRLTDSEVTDRHSSLIDWGFASIIDL